MLARIRKSLEEKDQGFTLIELLVVMIIIGILAAIAIPVFLNQRAKARETSAKSDVSTIGKELSAFYVDGGKDLTVVTASKEYQIKDGATIVTKGAMSADNVATGTATAAGTFCVQVSTAKSGDSIWAFTEKGLVKANCSGAAVGTADAKVA